MNKKRTLRFLIVIGLAALVIVLLNQPTRTGMTTPTDRPPPSANE